jgi:hypothetical protein
MKERKKQAVRGRSVVLAAVLLGVLLVSISSIALAAPAPTASQEEVTMIDPFSIRIISVSGNPVNIQAVTEAAFSECVPAGLVVGGV